MHHRRLSIKKYNIFIPTRNHYRNAASRVFVFLKYYIKYVCTCVVYSLVRIYGVLKLEIELSPSDEAISFFLCHIFLESVPTERRQLLNYRRESGHKTGFTRPGRHYLSNV